jgi:L-gulono-1,4-lactone dehydrogenase
VLSVTWRNWGGTEVCAPSATLCPTSIDDVAAIVGRAADDGTTVKAVGSGHSFSGAAVTSGVHVDLSALRGLTGVDAAARTVSLAAGTRLHEIPDLLGPHRLAMPNLGDIDRQTVAGATSTGTHGTGLEFGGISTQIVGATLVTGTGDVVRVSSDDVELDAVALGLGALGILTDITLRCVPAFGLRAVETTGSADDAIDGFLDRVAAHDHHEFYWFPHTDCALLKANTRLDGDVSPDGPGRLRRYVDDELLSNKVFRALCEVGARAPRAVPGIAQLSGRALSGRTFTDSSTRVFVSSRTVRFHEMEYAIPLNSVPDAMREIRAMIARRRHRVSFPVEVRAAAADDLMLSTATGRDSGYIAVHRYHRDDPTDSAAYFRDVEQILTAYDGRPHWGKMHTRDAEQLRAVYPRFDEFLTVRDRFDPYRVFANPYLTRALGA